MQTTSEWALYYRSLGWSVIPLKPGEKRPLVAWEEFERHAASEQQIRAWLKRWPDANIGVVTGAVSGLVVLDVDPAHGGVDSLSELEQRNARLPHTVAAETGGGGRHFYFRHPGGVVRNRVSFAPGLDLRGDGGYVVAPPSIHPSGRPYAWQPSTGPDLTVPALLPSWLSGTRAADDEPLGHPLQYWRALVRDGIGEGARNNTIASLAGHLLWHAVDPAIVLDLLLCWNARRCRPPLSDDEVTAVVQSITRTHARHHTEPM